MRHAAREDERSEQPEHAVEPDVAPPADEIHQRERDGEIADCDQSVGEDVRPHHVLLIQHARTPRRVDL